MSDTPIKAPVAVLFVFNWILLWVLWVLMVGTLASQELAVGGFVAAIGAVFAVKVAEDGPPLMGGTLLSPRRALGLALYVPYLIWQIVLSNLDVARRVVSPSLPIAPGIVRIKTTLKSPLGRMVLANSITLTPGTLTLDVDGDELCIHWIDAQTGDIEAATKAIVGGFEKRLEVIFG
ncbi:MAG: Na+/H+ antiporter subunit E [Deltaproteobacteria bacterium]|nr:Na+/H+ antiporter subunit E [Deltaproteobacteria bacterium]